MGGAEDRRADRYEPLPGLLALPGWLYRKLSPAGRRVAKAIGALLALGTIVGAIVLVPAITASKREHAERERRQEAAARAAEVRRLRAEQRPRRGRLAAGSPVAQLESAITADAKRRVAAGDLETPVRRTDCEVLDENARRVLVSCTAVTSDIPKSAVSRGGRVGYPYRARIERAGGRYAFCKTHGVAAEGALGSSISVPLPRACGG